MCDPYFEEHEPAMRQGIRGLNSSAFYENVFQKYHDKVRIILIPKQLPRFSVKVTRILL